MDRRTIAFTISLILFLCSLFLETFHTDRESQPDAWSNGFANLLFGVLSGNVSWLANILIIPAWFLLNQKLVLPIFFSLMASILAFSFYFNGVVIINEAGHHAEVTEYKIGYWLWSFSMLSYFVFLMIILISEKRKQKTPDLNR